MKLLAGGKLQLFFFIHFSRTVRNVHFCTGRSMPIPRHSGFILTTTSTPLLYQATNRCIWAQTMLLLIVMATMVWWWLWCNATFRLERLTSATNNHCRWGSWRRTARCCVRLYISSTVHAALRPIIIYCAWCNQLQQPGARVRYAPHYSGKLRCKQSSAVLSCQVDR